jgi:hypothetical protein
MMDRNDVTTPTTIKEQIKALDDEVRMYASRVTWHRHQKALDDAKATLSQADELQRDAMALATLLDEMIGHVPLDAWPHLHEELKKQGHKRDYLKILRDKYADRYRNV